MQIEEWKVEDLKPYENNPRINDKAVDAVAKSISQFGFKNPIIIFSGGVVIAGHTRLEAAKRIGMDTVPVIIADDLTQAQADAFRLVDNKTAEIAEWDDVKLQEELKKIEEELDGEISGLLESGDDDEQVRKLLESISMEEYGFKLPEEGPGEQTGGGDPNRDTGFTYSEQYGVIVMCQDEAEQEKIYNRLTEEGFTCKVVAV